MVAQLAGELEERRKANRPNNVVPLKSSRREQRSGPSQSHFYSVVIGDTSVLG